ncbi:MAG TPA: CehA/McbA family metallohydrolase [Chloroflexota bacterium]
MTAEYEPLDLTAHRNAPASLLGGDTPPPTGQQELHGLPFLIGDGDRAFVAPEGPITIPVGQPARTLVFAHRLLESALLEGGPVGVEVAEYVFRLADGQAHRVPIRERFEIMTPSGWGQLAFRAVPDQKNGLMPRWEGRWDAMGNRQSEAYQGWPLAYYLWCWTNPSPDTAVESVEIVPKGPKFLLAAITLGRADEHPFLHEGAVPVRIELKDAELAARPIKGLEVVVDRGVAGYPWPLAETTPDAFLKDGMAGWGEAAVGKASPTYVEVAAIPSATLTVKADGETVDRIHWRDLRAAGKLETAKTRVEILEDGRNWVETVVCDDDTGQPIPCRVHFRSVHGVPYQPHGHHGHVNSDLGTWHVDVGGDLRLGRISYAYVDGRCQGWLPRGEVIVDVARGYEYEPLRQRITIGPEQRRLELRLKRWIDMNARGWYSGDTHVHFLSTVGSQREARAEDLNVVNLLLSQWGSLFTNTEEFTGEPLVTRDGKTIVWATQENRQHLLGHLTLLGLKKPVYPWCSDGPSEAELGGTLDTTLSHWADACRAQGGTVILPHLPNPNGEPSALIATGRVDGVEMIDFSGYKHLEYYRFLNAGYRLPLVGGTDKMSSEVAVGQYRTYVRVPSDEEFGYESWCRNLKLGRTFLSGGPILELQVDGAEIGDTVKLPAGGGSVEVVARARSTIPVHTLQLVQNGEVVAETRPAQGAQGARQIELRTRLQVKAHGWVCARVAGPQYGGIAHHDVWTRGVFAHTSPIYFGVGGEWEMADPAGLQYMLTLVEGSLQYIRELSPRRRPGTALQHHGEPDHQAYLERPFLEAREALHRRLHRLAVPH